MIDRIRQLWVIIRFQRDMATSVTMKNSSRNNEAQKFATQMIDLDQRSNNSRLHTESDSVKDGLRPG